MKTLTAIELLQAARAWGVPVDRVYCADHNYCLLTPADVTDKISKEYSSVLRQTGYEWLEDAFDCDNHALWCTAWVTRWHADNVKAGRAPLAGVAFGELHLATRAHAVVVAAHVLPNVGGVGFAAYEPQFNNRTVALTEFPLTAEDWRSVMLLKFQ